MTGIDRGEATGREARRGPLSKRRCNSPSFSLSVAGALVPAAAREEAQEARLRRYILRVRRLSTLLQRIRTTSAAGRCVPSPEEPGRTASKPVHGPALQGAMVPGKYIPLYGPTRAIRDANRTGRAYSCISTLSVISSFFAKWPIERDLYRTRKNPWKTPLHLLQTTCQAQLNREISCIQYTNDCSYHFCDDFHE